MRDDVQDNGQKLAWAWVVRTFGNVFIQYCLLVSFDCEQVLVAAPNELVQ